MAVRGSWRAGVTVGGARSQTLGRLVLSTLQYITLCFFSSIVEGVDTLTCPKDTEYCFLKTADPSSYDEKMQELCTDPTCETCKDICKDRRQCLDMKSRYCTAVLMVVCMSICLT